MEWTPLIISVAPNGAHKNKSDHEALPMLPDEIAAEAKACRDVGASLLHLHVRDAQGQHTLDLDAYRQAISAVRDAVGDDMIIQITTEAVGRYSPDEQIAVVRDLHPEATSVSLKELTSDGDEKACAFYRWAFDEGIALQHILYCAEEVTRLASLIEGGRIPRGNLSVLYVLGRYGDGESRPADLLPFLTAAQDCQLQPAMWSVCAFGAGEGAVAITAASLGGHVRVGFENNMYLNTKELALNNADLVRQAADGAKLLGRPLGTAKDGRKLMGPHGGNAFQRDKQQERSVTDAGASLEPNIHATRESTAFRHNSSR